MDLRAGDGVAIVDGSCSPDGTFCTGEAVQVDTAGSCQPICQAACAGDEVAIDNDGSCGCSTSFVESAIAEAAEAAESASAVNFDGAWLGSAATSQDEKVTPLGDWQALLAPPSHYCLYLLATPGTPIHGVLCPPLLLPSPC